MPTARLGARPDLVGDVAGQRAAAVRECVDEHDAGQVELTEPRVGGVALQFRLVRERYTAAKEVIYSMLERAQPAQATAGSVAGGRSSYAC